MIAFCKQLKTLKEFEIASQLLRSSTSIGANVAEAGAGSSRKDFISKMKIASKEARETYYWLRLISSAQIVKINMDHHLRSIEDIVKILTSIVKTSEKKKTWE